MNRKHFLSVNLLSVLSATKLSSAPIPYKLENGVFETIDIFTGENVTFSKSLVDFNGEKLSDRKCDGVIFRKIDGAYYKRNFTGPINVKWFGAKGDGIADDTNAFNNALKMTPKISYQIGGGTFFIPAGRYKITDTIIIDRSQIKISGAGLGLTIIEPTGSFDYAIQFIGQSFTNWLNAVELSNLTIKGNRFSGGGLKIENVGLRSLFENINVFDCGSKGIYCKSLFDHIYRNIEVRNCGEIGIHVWEQNKRTASFAAFEENSFLVFDNVRPIANNKNGIQWLIQGGDSFRLINCKPSEGLVGLRIDSLANRFDIDGLYIDGTGKNSVGVQIDDEYTRSINIKNLSAYQLKYAVEVINGRGINITNIGIEGGPDANLGTALYVHKDCVGNVTYDGFEDNYSKKVVDLSNGKLSTPIKFSGHKDTAGNVQKPFLAKIQTLSVDAVIKPGTKDSGLITVNLPYEMSNIYFVNATINHSSNLNNSPLYTVITGMHTSTSIGLMVKTVNETLPVKVLTKFNINILVIGDVSPS